MPPAKGAAHVQQLDPLARDALALALGEADLDRAGATLAIYARHSGYWQMDENSFFSQKAMS